MKHTWKRFGMTLLAALLLLSLVACSAPPNDEDAGGANGGADNGNANYEEMVPSGSTGEDASVPGEETAPTFAENAFIATAEQNVSTFSADVDTASYTYFRKLVNAGYSFRELCDMGASFRTEEFLNYFKYESTAPTEEELFGVKASILPTPWNPNTVLLTMTLQAEESVPVEGNNLVFLIDVSGSMMSIDKLPLLKKAFGYLVDQLTENDRISIVTYSGREKVVLEGCTGNRKEEILTAIDSLVASGSTNGESGLRMAYQVAEEYRIEGGNNRIIMASDGDLNVGITSDEELKSYVSGQRDSGIYLSVLGFGSGNYRDSKMEALADNGNGVYYYIDGESEAERVFTTNLLGTLYTVAEDVKMQLTLDARYVASYRLIGYENRILNEEDFTDDTKDAGEVGSGHQVTVCYELTLCADALTEGAEWMTLAVNYKNPGEDTSVPPSSYVLGYAQYSEEPTDDDTFRQCIIQLCMLLHNSKYLPEDDAVNLNALLATLSTMELSEQPARAEFVALLRTLIAA